MITSAVVTGRAKLRLGGLVFPARFRFTHAVGRGYRHDLEVTLFGRPVVRLRERYVDGTSRLELPFGVVEGPKVDQAANLGGWAEAVWFPALFITDPRVRWEAVDEATALLVVPFGGLEERFVARFHPETGLLHLLEAMRYKGAADAAKTLWLCEALVWEALAGRTVLTKSALTWFGDGAPWARWQVEEVVYNVDVRASLWGERATRRGR